MAYGLTPRQAQLLRFLETHPCPPPSYAAMAAHLYPAARHAKAKVAELLAALEARGYIRRKNCGRGRRTVIRILRRAPAQVHHLTREQGLAYARQWRTANKPFFDALYGPEAA